MRSKLLLVLALLIGSCGAVFAQGVIRGKVTDKKTGETLVGVRVTATSQEDKKPVGAISNKEGDFQVQNLKNGKYTLLVSYVGYKSGESTVTVDGGATVTANFQLVLDVKGLDEVVVTGVASRTQKAVSEVAVARVNASELTDKMGYTSTGQLLSGKVAGVTITPASGTVGGGLRFNVRSGAGLFGGSPVIFIDGVRVGGGNVGTGTSGPGVGGQQVSELADLNPADIENIEILKGAAASALYGTSGQNGVVLIKTKRGRGLGNNELTINYQGIYGFNTPSREITEQMAVSYKEANAIYARAPFAPGNKTPFEGTAPIIQHGVNLQGNSGIFNYYLGFEDRNEKGIVQQNELRRQSFRLNLDAVTSRDFSISGSVNYVNNFITRPQNDNNVLGWLGNTMLFSPFVADAAANGGGPIPRSFGTYQFTDSLGIALAENAANTRRLIASTEIKYAPSWLPGLNLRAVVGYDNNTIRFETLFPATQFYSGIQSGNRSIFTLSNERLNVDASANYEAKNVFIEGLSSNTTLGMQAFNTITRTNFIDAQRFGTDLVRDIGSGGATTFNISEFFENRRDAGVFLRQEFSYNQIVSLSLAARNDFASSLSPDASAIFYPQASTMLRIDKLGVLPEVVNLLKVRAAYGETGSLPGVIDAQRLLFTTGQSGFGPGGIVQVLGNPSVVPERIREIELGFEFELDNAYGGEFTYIIGNAVNSLINVQRAPSTGLNGVANGVRRNLGSIDQWGFESSLYARAIQSTDYELTFNVIFNYFDNVVRSIGNTDEGAPAFLQDGFNRQYIIPGQRRSQFIGPKPVTPRFNAAGYYDYVNGPVMDTARANGVLYTPTGALIGSPIGGSAPLYTGSFSINFRFLRDFTLYALAEFGIGGNVYNGTRQFHTNPTYANNITFNRLANQLGLARGQAGAQAGVSNIPRYADVAPLTPNTPEYQRAAEAFMRQDWISVGRGNVANFTESANWARLRELSLRFNATRAFNDVGIGVKNLAFTLTGTNLFLLTNYTGVEVEINGNPGSAVSQGQDFLTLQQARALNFMISLGF